MGTDKTDKTTLSRREFLKEAGIVAGGVALASLALSSACGSAETTVATTENTPPRTQTAATEPGTTTSSPAATTPTSPVVTTATVSTSTTPVITAGNPLNSNLLDVPGCSTKVAADRLYSLDKLWVKSMGANIVQLGMSDPFQAFADKVNVCSILASGTNLQADQPFGSIEADKIKVDLISPVSGKIIESNMSLTALPGPINSDPYGSGWMVNVALSKPSELDSLVSPVYYVYLESGKTGTAPPKR